MQDSQLNIVGQGHGQNGKVLIAAQVHPVLADGLVGLGYECLIQDNITQPKALTLVKDCVGVITSTRLQIDKSLIDAGPLLRWVGRMGSGMEVIDLEYAAEKRITCFSSPEGNCNAVAEHALGMLLSLIRRIVWSHNEMANGVWKREENRGIELEGKTIGIIGYGHTGQSFAKKLRGFCVDIMAYDKYKPECIPPSIYNCENLLPIFEKADIVSFHVPLQADTYHYLDERFISQMKKPFILLNTSRGTVVSLKAVQTGVGQGKITGACLDVFEPEPLAAMNNETREILGRLMATPNIIVTPHIAGYTHEALYKMSKVLLEKLALNL